MTEWAQDDIDMTDRATELAAAIATKIDAGTCPRCESAMDLGNTAGSRATRCRCVLICPRCGADEGNQAMLGTGISQAWRWPVRKGDITRRRNKFQKMAGDTVVGTVVAGSEGSTLLVSNEGVTELKGRPNPGGWSEFGFDDSEDSEQRER